MPAPNTITTSDVGKFVILKNSMGQILHAGRIEKVFGEPVVKIYHDGETHFWPVSQVEIVEEQVP